MNLRRSIKYYHYRFRRLQGSPHALAGGTAIGVFIGLTPTVPFHTLLIVFLSFMTRTSAIAGIIISWVVSNPLTYLPIYYISTLVGNYLTPYELNLKIVQSGLEQAIADDSFQNLLTVLVSSGYEALIVLIAGGFCFALPFGILSYYLSLKFFTHIQKKRMNKHVLS
jgi:hypothetical protein